VTRLRDVWLVAAFDLFESLRSRKALALMLLYVAGSVAASVIFVEALREVENNVAETLSVPTTAQPGAMTHRVMESEQVVKILGGLIGDRELAEELVTIPPLALFYGWIAMTFIPVLVVLTSSDAISGELASGSARFALFRTDRYGWAAGKLAGQAALMAVGVVGGAIAFFVVGALSLARFDAAATGWWLFRMSGRSVLLGFSWVGVTMGVSQLTRSVPWSRGLALIALVALGGANGVLATPWALREAPVLAPTLRQLLPGGYKLDLWRPDIAERLPAIVMLLALGGLYFAAGHAVFQRRDR